MLKKLGPALLVGCVVTAGCENAQERARYVKEPLETADATSVISINQAVRESKTRLLDVRSRELRAELSKDIDDEYQRMFLQIQEAQRREKERADAQAERERAAADLEARREAMRLQKEHEAEEAEARRVAAEQAEARRVAEQAAQERAAADLEAREAMRRQKEHDAELAEARRAAESTPQHPKAPVSERDPGKQVVVDLEVGMRPSLLGDGTKVLVLRNTKSIPAMFNLRCYRRGDTANKTFMVTVRPHSETNIGFLQGWCGNFRSGERCEAYYDGKLLWKRVIP